MDVPAFLLRKLYRRGSLRETGPGRFAFALQNPLATATVVGPPHIVVNGVAYDPAHVEAGGVDLAALSPRNPWTFHKGASLELRFPGTLMRGGNRIHVEVETDEFGPLVIHVEDREAGTCDIDAEE